MSLNLPTAESNPTYPAQAVLDATDLGALALGLDRNGVITGCAVTAQSSPNYTVQVAAGDVMINDLHVHVAAVASIAPTNASNPGDRRDIVVVNSSGVVSIVAGTACAVNNWTTTSGVLPPVKPAVPANSIILGELYIVGGASNTNLASGNIVDKTCILDFADEWFGDASDGSVTFDGSTTVLGIAPTLNTYQMVRDIYCNVLTINAGITLSSCGYRVFARSIQGSGLIRASYIFGNAALGTVSGSNNGNTAGGAGAANGTNSPNIINSLGGRGGAGGAGNGTTGGTAGTVTAPVGSIGVPREIRSAIAAGMIGASTTTYTPLLSGSGGGSGGGGGAGGGTGGSSGYDGGICVVVAKIIASTITISAVGSVGAAATGTNAGGGGGGGGGVVIIVSATPNAPSTNVAGGLGGAKTGTGTAGSAGSAGTVILIQV